MTIEEKEILAFIDKSSHPVDISEIRGVFKEFEVQTINNLTTQGYIEELERVGTVYSIEGKEDFTYVVYRVKEKAHQWFPKKKENNSHYCKKTESNKSRSPH